MKAPVRGPAQTDDEEVDPDTAWKLGVNESLDRINIWLIHLKEMIPDLSTSLNDRINQRCDDQNSRREHYLMVNQGKLEELKKQIAALSEKTTSVVDVQACLEQHAALIQTSTKEQLEVIHREHQRSREEQQEAHEDLLVTTQSSKRAPCLACAERAKAPARAPLTVPPPRKLPLPSDDPANA